MAKKGDIVDAAIVMFGQQIDIGEVHIRNEDDPERTIIFQDSVEKLSAEAKLVLSVILRLPEEMFDKGKIVHRKLFRFMKARYGWKAEVVKISIKEIRSIYE
jgi:hypothetical protein